MRVIKALDRVFNLPDGTTDDQVKKFLSERKAEQDAGVDAVTSAQPPNPDNMKTGTVNRTPAKTSLIDNDSLKATVMIESSGDPSVENSAGFKGLLQLGDARAKELGVADPFDPKASIEGYMKHAEQAKKALEKDGLEFNPFHSYILWQQGLTGGRDILKNMDVPLKGFKRERNMRNNLPPTESFKQIKNPTVKDWYEGWKEVFEDRKTASLDIEQWLA